MQIASLTTTSPRGELQRTDPADSSADPESSRSRAGHEVDRILKTGDDLSTGERERVAELKKVDREVRAHEQAHLTRAGPYVTGGPTFTYVTGPDGRQYASSRPGESHPQALTEPDMNVSAHPALTVQPLLDATSASGQRAPGRRPRWPVSGAPSAGDAAASVCISLPPNGPTVGQGTEAWGKAPMDSTDRSTSATPG